METIQPYLLPYIISNLAAIIFLISSIYQTKLTRFLFLLLFGWASWLNYTVAHQNPEDYLAYADLAIPIYRDFINGWFKNNITKMVTLISVCQGLIAFGMAFKGVWVKLACFGSIIFFLSIAPLGVGAAFPFPLITAFAAYLIIKKDNLDYLWKFKKVNQS
ncbi:MAG TPA: hypothetical protein VK957_02815 [Lunatimonas sp.]|nr:hypothetical protein [Lunatimonas sp.]